jgi:hypothetical protein
LAAELLRRRRASNARVEPLGVADRGPGSPARESFGRPRRRGDYRFGLMWVPPRDVQEVEDAIAAGRLEETHGLDGKALPGRNRNIAIDVCAMTVGCLRRSTLLPRCPVTGPSLAGSP